MSAQAEAVIHVKPVSFKWRRPRSSIPAEQINRQGRITHLAYSLLGGRDPAMLFLNAHHAAFGATPLELAGKSAAGYATVQSEVRRLSLPPRGEQS